MPTRLNWGILGTGNIAKQFATGVNGSDRGTLTAVGSRHAASANDFAAAFHVPRAHPTYEALIADPTVDAVYVSLPNSMHHEWTLRALAAGKHVLCEKPLATHLQQAREMFDAAQSSGNVLVEAFMYRSHPQTLAIQKLVSDGVIGELRLIRTSFVYPANKIQGNVRFDAALAGGSLMDIGCYCLSLSRLLAGEPRAMHAFGHVHESGVDDYAAAVLQFDREILATFQCGMTVHADNTAHIMGTKGRLEIPVPWKSSEGLINIITAEGTQSLRAPSSKHLYALEADDFAATVLDHAPPRVTREDSLGNQQCLDELRRQIGVRFDG